MLCLEAHHPFLMINRPVVIKTNIASQNVGTTRSKNERLQLVNRTMME